MTQLLNLVNQSVVAQFACSQHSFNVREQAKTQQSIVPSLQTEWIKFQSVKISRGQPYPCPDNLHCAGWGGSRKPAKGSVELQRAAEQISGELGCQGDTKLESDFSAKATHLFQGYLK